MHETGKVYKLFDEYSVEISPGGTAIRAYDGSFNLLCGRNTGKTWKWGKTVEENPTHCPWGPEIADIEITTACNGIRDKEGNRAPCMFCVPGGTQIITPDGSVAIEELKPGDKVVGSSIVERSSSAPVHSAIVADVLEVYSRPYEGSLICIELDDGSKLKCTPEHPIRLTDGSYVAAGELTADMDIESISAYTKCRSCGRLKLKEAFYERYYCSKECADAAMGHCLICGGKVSRKGAVFCTKCVDTSNSTYDQLRQTWCTMLYRCFNPNRNKHEFYVDAGVSVCDRWLSFKNFKEDMGDKPGPEYTLDRIDNSKGYCKENCRWVDQRVQKLNRGRFAKCKDKYKGVHRNVNRWVAAITISGKKHYLGSFLTAEEAARAYDKALLANGGDLAHCNFKEVS